MSIPSRDRPGRPAAGVARTFQNIRLFPNMTALENVLVGRHCRTRAGILSAIGRGPRFRGEERAGVARARELLELVGLRTKGDTVARYLSYGDQRRVEIAKTTTLRTVSGLLRPAAGEVWFEGERIDAVPAHRIVARGLAHAPEGRHVFPRLSVGDNLELGAFVRTDRAGVAADLDRAYELFPVLRERSAQAAGTLSGGEQQMLAIARALMSRPTPCSCSTSRPWGCRRS